MDLKIALVHTSTGAISPLIQYFSKEAPHYTLTNLLDDGLMSYFSSKDHISAVTRLVDMINVASNQYDVQAAIITCSAVSQSDLALIQSQVAIPVLKIDIPMAEYAVRHYQTIGLVATFSPGGNASMELLRQIADRYDRQPDIEFILVEEAYTALLAGDKKAHDRQVINTMYKYKDSVDAFVLSQVSMSPLKGEAENILAKPVLSSPEECLKALKELTTV